MSGYFRRISKTFENAENFSVYDVELPSFAPIENAVHSVHQLISSLADEEDEQIAVFKRLLWNYRRTVLETPLNFNDNLLELSQVAEEISRTSESLSVANEHVVQFRMANDDLIGTPVNPKAEWVRDHLSTNDKNGQIAIVVKSGYRKTPESDEEAWAKAIENAGSIVFLESRAELIGIDFADILVPFNGRFCSLLQPIFTTYCTRSIHHIHYRIEGKSVPSFNRRPNSRKLHESETASEIKKEVQLDILDTWADNDFWARVRSELVDSFEHDELAKTKVPARLCYFQSGKAAFLNEDQRYIELSELIELGVARGSKLPRKLPKQLHDGDLVLLRTEGSGDYLYDIADQLLKKEGKQELRQSSLDWKLSLERCLMSHGPTWIAERMGEQGGELRDPNYIWIWSTDVVMRPASKLMFAALIDAIEGSLNLGEVSKHEYCDTKWEEMRELQRYHHRAGVLIRKQLLDRLSMMISRGGLVSDETVIRLSAESGSLTVFTVQMVDDEVAYVPYTRIGEVH